jgi:hypothetical protein
LQGKALGQSEERFALQFAASAVEALTLPADLARVVSAWPDLAPDLKAAVLAILASAGK